ncbi:hypothetical protein EU534_02230 [Candidatus Heimdallarchaeota archaeon]|nr:MAG: hypothetical protein EU534_02230 [Candidatus Heimdallarchaeota archaeon]
MPSEYIMYLSILLVGSLAIAGISVTMMAIDNAMEERAIETNFESILQSISEIIHNLKIEGEEMILEGATSITISFILGELPEEIQQSEYQIDVLSNEETFSLKAYALEVEDAEKIVSLFISPTDLSISGSILSTDPAPTVTYIYDGISSSIILDS